MQRWNAPLKCTVEIPPGECLYDTEPPEDDEQPPPSSNGGQRSQAAARRALLGSLADDGPTDAAARAQIDLLGLMNSSTELPLGVAISNHIDAQYSTLTRLMRDTFETIVERHKARQKGTPRTRLTGAPAHWTVSAATE